MIRVARPAWIIHEPSSVRCKELLRLSLLSLVTRSVSERFCCRFLAYGLVDLRSFEEIGQLWKPEA